MKIAHEQRRDAVAVRELEIRAALDEQPCDVELAFACGVQQRRLGAAGGKALAAPFGPAGAHDADAFARGPAATRSAERSAAAPSAVVAASMSAPASSKRRTSATCPCLAAIISAVWPKLASRASTATPCSSSAAATSTLPTRAACKQRRLAGAIGARRVGADLEQPARHRGIACRNREHGAA